MKVSKIKTKLEVPFTNKELEYRVDVKNTDKTKRLALVNIQARSIQNRLDEALKIDGWSNII